MSDNEEKEQPAAQAVENSELVAEKKDLKFLLICSGVGLVIGIIAGIIAAPPITRLIITMWFGIGLGGAATFVAGIPGIYRLRQDDGFVQAILGSIREVILWLLLFLVLGPVALIIRLIWKGTRIMKLQEKKAEQ